MMVVVVMMIIMTMMGCKQQQWGNSRSQAAAALGPQPAGVVGLCAGNSLLCSASSASQLCRSTASPASAVTTIDRQTAKLCTLLLKPPQPSSMQC
jgi:uncharacterized lipoprotein NlpE involved in copper resistance